MGADEPRLGELAKRWLRAKKTELLTGNNLERQTAATEAGNVGRDISDRIAAQATYAAVPGLGRWKQSQDDAAAQRAADERAEVLALPRAQVAVTVSGAVAGTWTGELPVRWDPDRGEALSVELVVLDDAAPTLGGTPFLGLRLLLPGCTGTGHYDLAELARQSPDELDAADWAACLGNRDEPYYWVPGECAGTLDVTPGALTARLQLQGAAGDLTLEAHLGGLPG